MSNFTEKDADAERGANEATTALLIIDMINDLEFEGGEALLKFALPAAKNIAALRRRMHDVGLPVIYANDNFGKWKSNFQLQVDRCLHQDLRGRPIVELLKPEVEDYFVLKPRHSGFYGTTLDILLRHLEVRRLIITGVATDICVLFTANDAYMREYDIIIPSDCVAANSQTHSEEALVFMRRVLKADIKLSSEIVFRHNET